MDSKEAYRGIRNPNKEWYLFGEAWKRFIRQVSQTALSTSFMVGCQKAMHTVYTQTLPNALQRTLWRNNAAGERYDAFGDVGNCDMVLVMGTSLSGLTIDDLAHR